MKIVGSTVLQLGYYGKDYTLILQAVECVFCFLKESKTNELSLQGYIFSCFEQFLKNFPLLVVFLDLERRNFEDRRKAGLE